MISIGEPRPFFSPRCCRSASSFVGALLAAPGFFVRYEVRINNDPVWQDISDLAETAPNAIRSGIYLWSGVAPTALGLFFATIPSPHGTGLTSIYPEPRRELRRDVRFLHPDGPSPVFLLRSGRLQRSSRLQSLRHNNPNSTPPPPPSKPTNQCRPRVLDFFHSRAGIPIS